MEKFNKSNFIRNIGIGVTMLTLTLMFSFMSLTAKAYAGEKYFNSYYLSLNAGDIQTKPANVDGFSFTNSSGGTINLSFGKNLNINNIIIGGEITLGYANNGSWTWNNFDGYGDNAKLAVTSGYFIAAIKAGYAFKNIMPFVKLGYIRYASIETTSFSGPYSSDYYISPINSSDNGIIFGTGIEYMFNHNWGMTAQYFKTSLSGGDSTGNYTVGVDYNF